MPPGWSMPVEGFAPLRQSVAAVRSLLTWGSIGKFSDPSGQFRQAMYNMVDHPIPPMQGFRNYLVGNYGEANARAMTHSLTGALGDIIDQRGGDLSWANAARIQCPVL